MKDYTYLQQKYTTNSYSNRGLILTSGKGAYLFDQNHNKYIDMMTNYGVNIFGYGNKTINNKIINQVKNLPTLHSSFSNNIRAEAAQQLVSKTGKGISQVYFSNSGAEAIEAALKFAVLTTGKKKFIVCDNGYHGKTLGALSATSGTKYKQPFTPLIWEFISIPYNNTRKLESHIDSHTAAFIVEPIQGEGGIIVPDEQYLHKVREICDKYKILLIIDEIQTGVGRTGRFIASDEISHLDILCLGKGLAGGIPVGATLVSDKVAGSIPKQIHTSTFGGNPLACAGILATLSQLDNKLLLHISKQGDYFIKCLESIKSTVIKNVRGKGLMIGVEVNHSRNNILKQLQKNRILAIPAAENVIRLLPSYVIEKTDIDFVTKKLQEIIRGF